jgi:phosphoribosyl 1,2-cyclic phosphodiesterase
MSVHFCVLGSGSVGNAALLVTPHAHVLIDIGFSPNELAARMEGTGVSWESLDAIVLTHLHDDHIKRKCLVVCARHEIEFICHQRHAEILSGGRSFEQLRARGLVRTFDGAPFETAGSVRFRPVPLPHDCPHTFGFRIEAPGSGGRVFHLGYLADLGECSDAILEHMSGVDLLALEFNHDETLERQSGRNPRLIQRVLGPEGHLSNKQAAEVFRRILECGPRIPQVLIQIHLSRECNSAELAFQAAQEVLLLTGAGTQVFSSKQDRRGTMHCLA